jgi:hypothetical protein
MDTRWERIMIIIESWLLADPGKTKCRPRPVSTFTCAGFVALARTTRSVTARAVTVNQTDRSGDARKETEGVRKPASRPPQIQIPCHTLAPGSLPSAFLCQLQAQFAVGRPPMFHISDM